jgi:hypothetical protein
MAFYVSVCGASRPPWQRPRLLTWEDVKPFIQLHHSLGFLLQGSSYCLAVLIRNPVSTKPASSDVWTAADSHAQACSISLSSSAPATASCTSIDSGRMTA